MTQQFRYFSLVNELTVSGKRVIRKIIATLVVSVFLVHNSVIFAQSKSVDQFHKVKLLVNTGDKGAEADVILRLEEDRLVIRSRAGGSDLKVFPYSSIKSAEYSYSQKPRWKEGIATAFFIGIFSLPVFFMKSKKHWLTITTDKDFAVLRLAKKNYKVILPAFEAHSGLKIETVADEK
ncbi:MAG: hypothetical protein D6735_01905 [Acidobacteria bacterium]|nr:MAG: hypothetical protein D6735_01905 [Acidobacteriota bacterium]